MFLFISLFFNKYRILLQKKQQTVCFEENKESYKNKDIVYDNGKQME
jgi:hypothetical protein